jgi:REP element-mobilizing transposase RayT
MARVKQLSFLGVGLDKPRVEFGGDLLKNSNAKTQRPLDSKLPVHLVLRSKQSIMRLPKNLLFVNSTIEKVCKKHGVRLYEFANVGNHLHLLIKIPKRSTWAAFIRELTGRIAYKLKLKWDKLPFTRLVAGWRKAYQIAKDYVVINGMEASGYATREQIRFIRNLEEFWATG